MHKAQGTMRLRARIPLGITVHIRPSSLGYTTVYMFDYTTPHSWGVGALRRASSSSSITALISLIDHRHATRYIVTHLDHRVREVHL